MTNKLKNKLFLHATNVHTGGGRSLLNALLQSFGDELDVVALLDARMKVSVDLICNLEIKRVTPSIWQRFRAEYWLVQNVLPHDTVLCFGNLPPLFKLRGRVVVFVQNRYLIDGVKLRGFSLKPMFRIWMERLWLSVKTVNANEFVVQTPSMRSLLMAKTNGKVPVSILPFVGKQEEYTPATGEHKKLFDFLYVASGEPHKNHRKLIEAWCLLAGEGLFPSLQLTLNEAEYAALCVWMKKKISQCQLRVVNKGFLPHDQIKLLYEQAGALIYPSTFESFGLPLIEARRIELPILAAELDYVRDVLNPEQTFDPNSAVSIARAVKRFMGEEGAPLKVQDAAGFIKHILEGGVRADSCY